MQQLMGRGEVSVAAGDSLDSDDGWRGAVLASRMGVFLWHRLRDDQGVGFEGLLEESGTGAFQGVIQWSTIRVYWWAGAGWLDSQVASGGSGSSSFPEPLSSSMQQDMPI